MSNKKLVDSLITKGVLKTPEIIKSLGSVDRGKFVPKEYVDRAYEDIPLPLGHGSTISQPYTVVFMLELLSPVEGDIVLDVGSGSGWSTSLISKIIGETGYVFGVEIEPEMVKFGQKNIKKLGLKNAEICKTKIIGNEHILGLPEKAPFDKILVSATALEFPESILDQLKSPGRLVIPVRNSIWVVDKSESGEISSEEYPGFVFVPLR